MTGAPNVMPGEVARPAAAPERAPAPPVENATVAARTAATERLTTIRRGTTMSEPPRSGAGAACPAARACGHKPGDRVPGHARAQTAGYRTRCAATARR